MCKAYGWLWKYNSNLYQSSTERDQCISANTASVVSGNTFQQNQEQFSLHTTKNGLKRSFESNDDDLEKQRPAKQVSVETVQRIRAERFKLPQDNASKSFKSGARWVSPVFVEEAIKRNPLVSRSEQVEKAADGIRREARLLDKVLAGDKLAELLLEVKDKSWIEIAERVVYVFTRESFLYAALNTALRKEDLSKVDTLGPFCNLLWNSLSSEDLIWKFQYKGTVYRSANLTPEAIEDYKNSIGKSSKEWLGFSSTTKQRKVADMYDGNTLFIVRLLSKSRHLDISSISHFPEEEEVLLCASTNFQIKAVSSDKESGRNVIELKVLW